MSLHLVRYALLALCCLPLACLAQEITATIAGTVWDVSGAVIPGATVEVFSSDKNSLVRQVRTSNDGQYVMPLLPGGNYRVTAAASGFKTQRSDSVSLSVNDRRVIDFRLEVGSVFEVVEVEARQSQVDLESMNTSRLVSGTEVREMAIMTRNFTSLVPLQPGVSTVLDTDQPYVGTTNPNGGTNLVGYSINGARPEQNSWIMDGANILDRGANLSIMNYPSVDSIQEFNVVRNSYTAEFGGGSSAQISVITRSGTSQFHGTAYEFFRNDVLAANNYFNNRNGIERPPLRYNNFGFAIGGPVFIPKVYNEQRNKTFFFYSMEWRKAINYGSFYVTGVPTLDERNGLFATPVCSDADPFTGNCPGALTTQITQFDPTAAAYIKDIYSNIPQPSPDHTLYYTSRETFDFRQINLRLDHTFNSKYSLFARFVDDSIPTVEANGLFSGPGLPGVQTTRTESPGRGFTARFTMIPKPNLLNEIGYAYSSGGIYSTPIGTISSAISTDIRPNLPYGIAGRVPSLYFLSGNPVSGFGPYTDTSRQHAIYDTLTVVKGRHTLKFGGSWTHYEKIENTFGVNNGYYFFMGNDSNGNPSFAQQWANLLVGSATVVGQYSQDIVSDVLQHQFDLFAQDTYRIRPNLTLSFGLRWSILRQPTDGNGFASTFDPLTFNPAAAPAIDISTGNLAWGTPTPVMNGIIIGGQSSPYGDAVARQKNNCFAPRIGFAWDPFGTGQTSIRGGYGIYYDTPRIGIREASFDTAFVTQAQFWAANMTNPTGGLNLPNLTPQQIKGPNPDWQAPYVQQWSLGVQRQFGTNGILDIGYYGGKGTHLLGMYDLNQPLAGAYRQAGIPGPITNGTMNLLNYVRPYQGFSAIPLYSTMFDSNYNSMQAQYRQTFKNNSTFIVNYTWSHALTDSPDIYSVPQNNADLRAEYGPAPFDRRHIFSGSYVFYLPFYQSQRGWTGHLLGGWELSGAVYAYTGLPLTVTSYSIDPAGLGLLCCYYTPRADQLGDANGFAQHTVEQWFPTSVFATPPADGNRPGNSRNGSVSGPGAVRWDASVLKNTRISERFTLQFRVEASNVLNHTNFSNVGTNLDDPLFGQVTSAREPRIVQLGLKLNF